MPRFKAIPAEGQNVKSPDHGGAYLPAEGAPVTWSAYWQRRLDDGDITREEIKDAPASQDPPAPDFVPEPGKPGRRNKPEE